MEQYQVTGMSCAACSARVEKAVKSVPGVTSCAVSLLTNSMGVEGTASADAVISAVAKAGYGASLKSAPGPEKKAQPENDPLKDTETPKLLKRLIASVCFLLPLMYFSMGHMMFGWPLPKFFDNNHVAMGLAQMLLAIVIIVINKQFFISGVKGVLHRAPNMDTLVAMGSGTAFLWSLFALFMMTRAAADGSADTVMKYMSQLNFEASGMILTLITVGKTLEARSKGRTTDALKGLMRMKPKQAVIVENGEEKAVPVENVKIGDVFLVRPGESVPVDGVIIDGGTAIDESSLTGESIPVDKGVGDEVSAATVNRSGFIKCRATRVGEDTTLSKIIKMVSDAASTKAPIAKIADKVSGVFVPVVIGIALVTTVLWLVLSGNGVGYALERGIAVLVISCPCALGLATPVAIMVGSGVGAKNGILFKTAVSLEETGRVRTVILDKTGTITKGEPTVTDILPADGYDERELLSFAAAVETKSEHPLAKAICLRAKEEGISPEETTAFEALPGSGVEAVLNGQKAYAGSVKFIGEKTVISENMLEKASAFANEGKTPLAFMRDGAFLGLIAVADVTKDDSAEAIGQLRNMGLEVVMLTGDNEKTANAIGRQAGVDRVIAGVLPDQKEEAVRSLARDGKTAMIGDGVNDAPALTRADVGIAIGAGTDVAIDAADIVLMKSSLKDAAAAIRLSRATLRDIKQNLFWAFFYNALLIPLAAGVFIPLLGWELDPMYGAAAMSLSSFCVCMNALRLNLFRLYDEKNDRPQRLNKAKKSDTAQGEIEIKIKGMMCEHCEKRVRDALAAIEGVAPIEVSHEKGAARVSLVSPVEKAALRKVIEDAGYKVTSI
ncbi:MAG: cadmium-translocating P-type ATPase [Clostridia bacterium]|nr:cadmium-translocating P-type ATPase [Clostridia bacterium]